MKELIKALRCSATPYSKKNNNCNECRYLLKEDITEELEEMPGLLPDVIEDVRSYYITCDCDRMVLEAAEELENIEEMKQEVCEKICKWPYQLDDQEELEVKCKECPLERRVESDVR